MIEFIEFTHASPWRDRVLGLRDRALRAPLGLRIEDDDLSDERGQRHFALVDGDEPVACVIAKPLADGRHRLRQMAVAEDARGRGLGRRMVEHAEAALRADGATELVLHARADVVGFYEKLGYAAVGEEFVEVTIPHQAMQKTLARDA